MTWILLTAFVLFVGLMIYKQTKKSGTSKGTGVAQPEKKEPKEKEGDVTN